MLPDQFDGPDSCLALALELEKAGTQALRRIDAKEVMEQANITSIISAIRGISESR